MSTQPDQGRNKHENGIEELMEVSEEVPSRSELRALLMNGLNHIEVNSKKEAMRLSIKDTLFEASKLNFQAAKSGMKSVFICFLEMALINSFDRFSHSDEFMDALLKSIHKHPALTQNTAEVGSRTTERKIADGVKSKDY